MTTTPQPASHDLRAAVTEALERTPICAVVRTDSDEEALRQARAFLANGLEMIEITWSVPGAIEVTRELLRERGAYSPGGPVIGMGTVTTGERTERSLAVGSEFIVSPNTSVDIAGPTKEAARYLMMGALSASEIVTSWELGSDIVKVYPLPPVGGPNYLSVVRQPLADIPMLAGGGYDIDEIPAYRAAGASAFGIGGPLMGKNDIDTAQRIERAISFARGTTT